MALPIGIGDAIFLAEKVYSIYQKCSSAPAELHEVGKDVNYLHHSMVFLRDILKTQDQFIGSNGQVMVTQLRQDVKEVEHNLKAIKKLFDKWAAILRMPSLQSQGNKVLFIFVSVPKVEDLHRKLQDSDKRIQGTINLLGMAGKKPDEEAIIQMVKAILDSRAKDAKEARKRGQELRNSKELRKERAHTVAKAVASKEIGAWEGVQEDLVKKGMSVADAKKMVEEIRNKLAGVESAHADPSPQPSKNQRRPPAVKPSSDVPKPAPSPTNHPKQAPYKQPTNLAPPNTQVTRRKSDASVHKTKNQAAVLQGRSRSASREEDLKSNVSATTRSSKPDHGKKSEMLEPANKTIRRAKSDASVRKPGEKTSPGPSGPGSSAHKESKKEPDASATTSSKPDQGNESKMLGAANRPIRRAKSDASARSGEKNLSAPSGPGPFSHKAKEPKKDPANQVVTIPTLKPSLKGPTREKAAGGILHSNETIVPSMIAQTYLELVRAWTVNTTGRWLFDHVSSAGAWLQSDDAKHGAPRFNMPPETPGKWTQNTAITAVAKTFYNSREKDEIVARMQQHKPRGLDKQDFMSYTYILCLDTDVLTSVELMKAYLEDTNPPVKGSLRARSVLITGLNWNAHMSDEHPHKLARMVFVTKLALERFLADELGWRRPTVSIWAGPSRTRQMPVAKHLLDTAGIDNGESEWIKGIRQKEGCEVRISDAESEKERLVSITGPKPALEKAGLWPQWNEAHG
ncbi:MAG: hypothetical protein M1816_007194 [Peltula sp. TS41687]|nr:MAG: hypothetical protein M1816_007194 [Peltula sp. TS41687]